MSGWVCSASGDQRCGRCGARIPSGTVFYRIEIPDLRRRPVRCATCVGDRVPPPLPEQIETTARVLPFTRLGLLPLDWKRRASGGD